MKILGNIAWFFVVLTIMVIIVFCTREVGAHPAKTISKPALEKKSAGPAEKKKPAKRKNRKTRQSLPDHAWDLSNPLEIEPIPPQQGSSPPSKP